MTRLSADPALTRAREAVRAIALERLHARGGAALRTRLAKGQVSAEVIFRDAVREWVRSGMGVAGAGGHAPVEVTDEAYEHLLALSPRLSKDGARARGEAVGEGGEWDLVLERSRSARRSRAGAFYTPAPLIEWVLDAVLDPAIADARARRPGDRDAVLALRVCDPACGSGRFLVAAARRLGEALAADRAAGREPTASERADAVSDVGRECVYGVDIDDVAVEMCRWALGRLAGGDKRAGAALEAHVLVGDSLLGATAVEGTREGADAWCRGFFRGVDREREFFHWYLEFADVLAAGVGKLTGANAATSHDGLDARHTFPPPRCGGGSWGGFDVIVGNPPFLNQLQTSTAADAGVRALLGARFGGAVRGYADIASAFLLLATELVRPGGRVGFVLPRSLLAVEHAARVRCAVLAAATPTALWVSDRGTAGKDGFAGTNVATCAVALHKGSLRRNELVRASGAGFSLIAPLAIDADELASRPSWSHLFADADGVPQVTIHTSRTIGDLADATADFRDQYYGLQGFIVDSPEAGGPERRKPKLITSGLIAPLESMWGRIPTRVHKKKWLHPRVDLDALERAARTDPDAAKLAAWARARLAPKLLLATQTRVLEVLPDPEGVLLPCVPVITIVPKDPAKLWHVAAALSSPVASVVAMTRHAGAGMSVDAIKLSAKQVMALPAPEEGEGFDGAAAVVRAGAAGSGGDEAFELASAERERVLAWWRGRVPVGLRVRE